MARDDIMKGRYAQTLWDMTARRPLEAITASEIINCTGTARQTFYDHFSSKQALAGYVLEQWLSSATQDCPQRQTWLKSLELITTRAAERPLFFKGFAGLGAGPSSSQVLARAFSTCILHLLERKGCTPSATTQSAVAFYGFGIAGAFSTWITERELRDPFAASRIMYEGMPSELKRYLGGLVHTQPCKENATDIALASRFFLYQMFSCHPWIRTNRRADRASSRRTNAKRFAPVQHRRKRRRGEIRSHTCLPTARSRAQFLP